MREYNNHHVFFEKRHWRKGGGAAKNLMHLTTVLVPVHEVHKIIHEELPPLDVPTPQLAHYMLSSARSVYQRGVERLDTVIADLHILDSDEAQYYLEHLIAQRTLMAVEYPLEAEWNLHPMNQ